MTAARAKRSFCVGGMVRRAALPVFSFSCRCLFSTSSRIGTARRSTAPEISYVADFLVVPIPATKVAVQHPFWGDVSYPIPAPQRRSSHGPEERRARPAANLDESRESRQRRDHPIRLPHIRKFQRKEQHRSNILRLPTKTHSVLYRDRLYDQCVPMFFPYKSKRRRRITRYPQVLRDYTAAIVSANQA
jgi:hypothetical protein